MRILLTLLLIQINIFAQNVCKVKKVFENDLYASEELREYFIKFDDVDPSFNAYKKLYYAYLSPEIRKNTQLIENLKNDIIKYDLNLQFKNNPYDVLIWKKIKENPFSAYELIQETDKSSWLRFKKSSFYKAIFEKGNKFNDHMLPRIRGDLEANNVDLTDAVQVNELHVLPKKTNGYGKKVIMDNAFIIKTKETNALGIEIEYYKVIYNDNKFSAKSPWTPNQKEEIIHFFKDNPNTEYILLEFRTKNYPQNTFELKSGFEARLYRKDIYKTLSDGVNSNPQFGKIINMNNNGFK